MGRIMKVLDFRKIGSNRLCKTRICVDQCENIHLHIQDLRLEFSLDEWRELVRLVNEAAEGIEQNSRAGWSESDDDRLVQQWKAKTREKPAYFPDRLQIEQNTNGSFHLHYHNFRLEFNLETFLALRQAFQGKGEAFTIPLRSLKVDKFNGIRFETKPLEESAFYISLRNNDRGVYDDYRNSVLKKGTCCSWEEYRALLKSVEAGWKEDEHLLISSNPRRTAELRLSDGQHRASILLYLRPDTEVTIDEEGRVWPCIAHEDMQYA